MMRREVATLKEEKGVGSGGTHAAVKNEGSADADDEAPKLEPSGAAAHVTYGHMVRTKPVVWEDGEWVSSLKAMTVVMDDKASRPKLAALFEAAGVKLIADEAIKSLALPQFSGDDKQFYAWQREVSTKMRGIKATQYLTTSHYDMVKQMLSVTEKEHMLPKEVGGTMERTSLTPPQPFEEEEQRRQKLEGHANGAVRKMKEISTMIYMQLMKALEKEKHVTDIITSKIQALENKKYAHYVDDEEEQLGSAADPFALWAILHNKYKVDARKRAEELRANITNLSCTAVTSGQTLLLPDAHDRGRGALTS